MRNSKNVSEPQYGRVKTPVVFQIEKAECGAASLSAIYAYYGCYLPLEKMRIEVGVSRDGCTAKSLLQAARNKGMKAEGYKTDIQGLKKLPIPSILRCNNNHFVVYEGSDKKGHYINDPETGRSRISMSELEDMFSGFVLTFIPTEKFQKNSKPATVYKYMKEKVISEGLAVASLLCIGILAVFPGMMIPFFSKIFIDEILLGGNTSWINGLLVIMFFTAIMQCVLNFYRSFLLQKLQNKLLMISTHGFVSRLLRLPMNFYEQRYSGDLAERASNNESVNQFIAGDLGEALLNIVTALFYLAILLMYSPLLTLIGISCVAFNLMAMKLFTEVVGINTLRMFQDRGKLIGAVLSGISITDTLKASGMESDFVSRILGYYAKIQCLDQENGKKQQLINAIPVTSQIIANILILLFGGFQVIDGKMTAGMLVAYVSLLPSFIAPMGQLLGFMEEIMSMKADFARVTDITNYELDAKFLPKDNQIKMSTKLNGRITLNNITFGYNIMEEPLIHKLSLEVQCGSSIAIVGSSGCGKSTIYKMICGLSHPWSGEILVDDMPLKDIPQEILYASVSAVNQEVFVFSGTVKDNLTMWNKNILEEDIVRAAKDACIHDVIMQKPGGYDYMLLEGGMNLSGGQRQRLEIARALAVNPTILIMDEATSALDAITEKKIVDNIKRRGCTCIIIAHRLSAIRDCDQIIVMERGKVVRRGTHRELMGQEGVYRELLQNT